MVTSGCGLNRSTQHFKSNAPLQSENDVRDNSNQLRRAPQNTALTLQEVLIAAAAEVSALLKCSQMAVAEL